MSNQPSAASGERRLATLEGVLERITYANEENGCTVARVDTGRGAGDLLTVVGALLGAQVGELHDGAAGHGPGHPPLPRVPVARAPNAPRPPSP